MVKITPMIKRRMICMRADSCEYVMNGFIGTLSILGVVFSRRRRMRQAMREIAPSVIA